jgi:MFS transporter, PAT family, beta-lactamase induction signal transducer AmpG
MTKTTTPDPNEAQDPQVEAGIIAARQGLLSSPWLFVPAIYIVFGLGQGGIIGGVTQVLYKDLGYSNAFVGSLSLLQLPASFAFLIAPFLDAFDTKRSLCWKIMMILACCTALLAGSMYLETFFTEATLTLFFLVSVCFAAMGIASNGFYQRSLTMTEQARFSGIVSASIRGGMILGLILIVRIGAEINQSIGGSEGSGEVHGWAVVLAGSAVAFLLASFYFLAFLPRPPGDDKVTYHGKFPVWVAAKEYLKLKRVWAIIGLILTYRFGQGMQFFMMPPFYMDTVADGGMGVDAATVAMLKTYTDIPWMTLGGILGGFAIARYGLRATFLPLGILLNVPNIGYIALAYFQPVGTFSFLGDTFPTWLFVVSCVESFGYGMGFAPLMFYMYAIAKGPYRTSLLIISTSIMGMGWTLPGVVAGYVQQAEGYVPMFSIATGLGFLALIFILLVPIPKMEREK